MRRRAVRRRVAVGVVGLTASHAGAVRAQSQDSVPRRTPIECSGQRVSDVVVLTQSPYASAMLRRVAFVERTVRKLHATTRPEIIERFLLLRRGDRCDELRRSESERILRTQPYLVDARITPYPDGRGGVILQVETRDEFSTIIAAAVRTRAPIVTVLRLGEANLAGRAVYVSGLWRDNGPAYRDGYAVRLTDYQFMRRPYQLNAFAERRRVGEAWWADLTHPYYTDLQRVAWRAVVGNSNEFLELTRPHTRPNALFYRLGYASVGAVGRIGVPGRLSLFGVSMSTEQVSAEARVRVLTDSGVVPDAGPPLGFAPRARYQDQQSTRLNMLWGVRNVRFLGATGFDALTGRQDVRRGFQVGTVFGRGLAAFGSRDDDLFVGADAYVGMGSAQSFLAGTVKAEGRLDYNTDRWEGVVVSGRAAWYVVPGARVRTIASTEYAGGWRPRVPMQFALGAVDGGVRGYRDALVAGGQRVVTRLEQRVVVGAPFGLGDVGVALFGDAGRTFASDAPYGVTSPMRASVGVGLLGAFPPRSRRLFRVDVAVPLTREPGANRFQLLVSSRDLTRSFWREPRDVERGREQAVNASIFNWPTPR